MRHGRDEFILAAAQGLGLAPRGIGGYERLIALAQANAEDRRGFEQAVRKLFRLVDSRMARLHGIPPRKAACGR